MKLRRNTLKAIIISSFFFFCPLLVNAGSATVGFSGNNSVYIGENITLKMYISNIQDAEGGIVSAGGNLSFDNNCLEYVSGSGASSPYSFEINTSSNYKIAGLDTSLNKGITSQTTIFTFVFKAKAICNTTVTLKDAKLTDTTSKITTNVVSKSISITNPPSSNNNLSSLTISKGTLNFNKNNTNYTVSVDSDVSSITINAVAEDSGATISGTGNKNLNYGDNKIEIVVTSLSGAKKVYTVVVNRKDIRSSNNNLSSLKVGSGELSPSFNKNTTKYTLTVPYSVSNLDIKAVAEDSKASISISGNKDLVAEETKDVTITVTAENGSKKTYTISVTRGKNPNKKLSTNNYLTHLDVSVGILSPVFDKDITSYEVWLPYEVEEIQLDYGVEDTKYATVKFEGEDKLQAGIINVYKINVTAESNDVRTYTISVHRASNPIESNSNNTYIKDIKLSNGTLTQTFNKEVREYYYKKKKGFKIEEIVLEDENSAVSTVHQNGVYYLIVISSSGEYGVYTLKEQSLNVMTIILVLIVIILSFGTGYFVKSILTKRSKSIED